MLISWSLKDNYFSSWIQFFGLSLTFVITICDCSCLPWLFLPYVVPSEAEMSEVVIVTIPEAVDDLSSVEEQEKTVLVTAELTPQTG